MKKSSLLTLLIVINLSVCFSQTGIKRQIVVPMNNLNGVPYSVVEGFLSLDGFEIDKAGNFYFLNGNTKSSILVKVKENKFLYRKTYNGYIGSQLHIFNNNIYVLNYSKNNISVFATNGSLITRYNHITSENINSYRFVDSTLVIDTLDNSGDLNYALYSIKGQKIKNISNPYNLPDRVFRNEQATGSVLYLGKWNNKYLFWYIDPKRIGYEKFWLVNDDGEVLKTKFFESKQFGTGYEDFEEFKKLRNGSIFVFGHKGKQGIITELSPAEMFK